MHRSLLLIPALATVVSASGCASLNKKETGAIIGAASGAAVGGMVGRANGSTAKGAIIGAAVGGAAGAVIGHQMDQQAKELEQNIAVDADPQRAYWLTAAQPFVLAPAARAGWSTSPCARPRACRIPRICARAGWVLLYSVRRAA